MPLEPYQAMPRSRFLAVGDIPRKCRHRRTTVAVSALSLFILAGCKDLTGSQALPGGTPDPSSYNTAAGAIGMYNAAVYLFGQELPNYFIDTGLLTDEMSVAAPPASPGVIGTSQLPAGGSLDERILPTPGGSAADADYNNLNKIRGEPQIR